jgi:hypothetical protein
MNLREYRLWIECGAPVDANIIELDIRHGSQETVDFFPIYNIEIVNNLPNLQKLNCSYNKFLINIKNLWLDHLSELICTHCRIGNIDSLHLPALTHLNCEHNSIGRIHITHERLPELKIIRCNNNHITSVEINNYNLHEFLGNYNEIKTITTQTADCILQLKVLYCEFQQQTNDHIFVSPNILNRPKWNTSIMFNGEPEDPVDESSRMLIQSIVNIPSTVNDATESIGLEPGFTDETKELLFDYIRDKRVHTKLLLTFEELFEHVYSRMLANPHYKNEAIDQINTKLIISLGSSLTSRMDILINCLYDYDELVEILELDEIREAQMVEQYMDILK